MTYDKPIAIQRLDAETEEWSDYARMHARVNQVSSEERTDLGATRSQQTLEFRVRWDPRMREVELHSQEFRIAYEGWAYNVVQTDDYMRRHREFAITGESYEQYQG